VLEAHGFGAGWFGRISTVTRFDGPPSMGTRRSACRPAGSRFWNRGVVPILAPRRGLGQKAGITLAARGVGTSVVGVLDELDPAPVGVCPDEVHGLA
jgi:hypothetical protein